MPTGCQALWCSLRSVQFSRSVMSDSFRPRESQLARPPCPSPSPRVYSNSCSHWAYKNKKQSLMSGGLWDSESTGSWALNYGALHNHKMKNVCRGSQEHREGISGRTPWLLMPSHILKPAVVGHITVILFFSSHLLFCFLFPLLRTVVVTLLRI